IGGRDARNLNRIDDDRALLPEDRNSFLHHLCLRRLEPAALLLFAGQRDLVVEERSRNADARALRTLRVEESGVVAVRNARALRGSGIVGIRGWAFEDAKHDRRVRDTPG